MSTKSEVLVTTVEGALAAPQSSSVPRSILPGRPAGPSESSPYLDALRAGKRVLAPKRVTESLRVAGWPPGHMMNQGADTDEVGHARERIMLGSTPRPPGETRIAPQGSRVTIIGANGGTWWISHAEMEASADHMARQWARNAPRGVPGLDLGFSSDAQGVEDPQRRPRVYVSGTLSTTPVGMVVRTCFGREMDIYAPTGTDPSLPSMEDDIALVRPDVIVLSAGALHDMADRIRSEIGWCQQRFSWYHKWRYRRAIKSLIAEALVTGEPKDPSIPMTDQEMLEADLAFSDRSADDPGDAATVAAERAEWHAGSPYRHHGQSSLRILSLLRARLGGRCTSLCVVGTAAKEALATVIAHMGVWVFGVQPGTVDGLGPTYLTSQWIRSGPLSVPGLLAAAADTSGLAMPDPWLHAGLLQGTVTWEIARGTLVDSGDDRSRNRDRYNISNKPRRGPGVDLTRPYTAVEVVESVLAGSTHNYAGEGPGVVRPARLDRVNSKGARRFPSGVPGYNSDTDDEMAAAAQFKSTLGSAPSFETEWEIEILKAPEAGDQDDDAGAGGRLDGGATPRAAHGSGRAARLFRLRGSRFMAWGGLRLDAIATLVKLRCPLVRQFFPFPTASGAALVGIVVPDLEQCRLRSLGQGIDHSSVPLWGRGGFLQRAVVNEIESARTGGDTSLRDMGFDRNSTNRYVDMPSAEEPPFPPVIAVHATVLWDKDDTAVLDWDGTASWSAVILNHRSEITRLLNEG